MSAVHDLVAHTYILTLPRQKKVEAAMKAAENLLSVGWPKERMSLFVGADCKQLWGQPLVEVARNWHGQQHLDLDVREYASLASLRMRDNYPFSGPVYSTCDLSKPIKLNAPICVSACCALSHQLIMLHAFHFKTHDVNEHILILEEDAAFGNGALLSLSPPPPLYA
jgi:hypothetical protein